jgi:hypothetical protein
VAENLAAAAREIVVNDWRGDPDALASAVCAAADLSARQHQPPERFAEVVVGSLMVAGVSGTLACFALARALMPGLVSERAEIAVAFAQWQYLVSRQPAVLDGWTVTGWRSS